ncbi:AAA family ATPase [Vibrio splendidus]|uniref:AAA family ATPase n=1 Tax=Vibrio splendidus TaxID=29497 RepID=UPI0002E27A73|nr:ATP-binding protein [Vibrio splendidus]
MINSVFLDNYKHFESFKVDKLRRINVISGANNTGKSSLLEAIFFFYDRAAPDCFFKQLGFRGANFFTTSSSKPGSLWQSIFNNFDLSKKIIIRIEDSGFLEEAVYRHLEKSNNELAAIHQRANDSASTVATSSNSISSFHGKFRQGHVNMGDAYIYMNGDQVSLTANKLTQVRKAVVQVNSAPKSHAPDDADKLGQLIIDGQQDKIVKLLQVLEPRLTALSIVSANGEPTIYCNIGLSRLMPMYQMGEGLGKLLSILVSIASIQKGIICIDELENGIHYSLFSRVWKMIDELAAEQGNQIFVTTHNHDLLKGLSSYVKESNAESISYIRLDRVKNKLVPRTYDSEMLTTALDHDWEIR